MPITWLQGTPLQGGAFVGLQIWGVASKSGETCVTTVENEATGRARLWKGDGFRMLHLASVRGTTPAGSLAPGHTAQAQQMFSNVGVGLETHGFHYPDVARTWIYVARLLDWYDVLNKVRTAHYKSVGLGVPGGPAFPASTGIQCWSDGEECLVDVLALKSEKPGALVVDPIRCSPRQDQSFNYGSAFSRGMSIGLEGHRTIHISGTASINTAGVSTHIGDAECQSLETLMSIAAILEQQGGSLRNITSATLFCKDQSAWEAWNRVSRLLQLPVFPKVCVLADVCRHNLLVEMEAVAVI
jgi:enamine deaminase RidA (YjgF/YER057c/UK114 family)